MAFLWSHCLILIQPVVCMFTHNFRTNLLRLYLKTDTNILLYYDRSHINPLTAWNISILNWKQRSRCTVVNDHDWTLCLPCFNPWLDFRMLKIIIKPVDASSTQTEDQTLLACIIKKETLIIQSARNSLKICATS